MASRTFGGNSCASECVCRPVQSLRMCAVVAGAVLQIMQRSVLYSVGQMYLASTGVRIESVCSWRYSTPSRRVSCGCGAGSSCLLWRYHLRMSPYVSSGTGSLSSARSWLFRLRSECWLVCVARYVSPRAARSASSFRLRIRPSGSSGPTCAGYQLIKIGCWRVWPVLWRKRAVLVLVVLFAKRRIAVRESLSIVLHRGSVAARAIASSSA